MISDQQIYQTLIDHSDNEFSVPFFEYEEWASFCAANAEPGDLRPGHNRILPLFAKFVDEFKPPLPIKRPTVAEMESSFYSLKQTDYRDSIITNFDKSTIKNKFNEPVDIDFMVSCGFNFNAVSNHFHADNRYTCGYHSKRSNWDIWNDPHSSDFRSLLMYLWRVVGDDPMDINHEKYRAMFRLAGYVATQFKPAVAKTIYEHYKAARVIDMSCGWGDRLAGFYTSNYTRDYLGCDPNPQSYELYKSQCRAYESLLSSPLVPVDIKFEDHGSWFEIVGSKRVRIFNRPAEDMPWDKCVEAEYDIMFSSPPYFGIERYGEGKTGENNQSWKRYSEYDGWRDNFFFPVLFDILGYLKGPALVNIVDPVVKRVRYPVDVDLKREFNVSHMAGMKMSRRPSGKAGVKQYEMESGKRLQFIEPIYIINR